MSVITHLTEQELEMKKEKKKKIKTVLKRLYYRAYSLKGLQIILHNMLSCSRINKLKVGLGGSITAQRSTYIAQQL